MKNSIKRGINIYQNRGIVNLAYAIRRHVKNRISPIPAVTDPNSMGARFLFAPICSWHFSRYYGTGVDVVRENWDTLILLDACRFDDFESVNHIQGELSSRISQGVDSHEFIKKTL